MSRRYSAEPDMGALRAILGSVEGMQQRSAPGTQGHRTLVPPRTNSGLFVKNDGYADAPPRPHSPLPSQRQRHLHRGDENNLASSTEDADSDKQQQQQQQWAAQEEQRRFMERNQTNFDMPSYISSGFRYEDTRHGSGRPVASRDSSVRPRPRGLAAGNAQFSGSRGEGDGGGSKAARQPAHHNLPVSPGPSERGAINGCAVPRAQSKSVTDGAANLWTDQITPSELGQTSVVSDEGRRYAVPPPLPPAPSHPAVSPSSFLSDYAALRAAPSNANALQQEDVATVGQQPHTTGRSHVHVSSARWLGLAQARQQHQREVSGAPEGNQPRPMTHAFSQDDSLSRSQVSPSFASFLSSASSLTSANECKDEGHPCDGGGVARRTYPTTGPTPSHRTEPLYRRGLDVGPRRSTSAVDILTTRETDGPVPVRRSALSLRLDSDAPASRPQPASDLSSLAPVVSTINDLSGGSEPFRTALTALQQVAAHRNPNASVPVVTSASHQANVAHVKRRHGIGPAVGVAQTTSPSAVADHSLFPPADRCTIVESAQLLSSAIRSLTSLLTPAGGSSVSPSSQRSQVSETAVSWRSPSETVQRTRASTAEEQSLSPSPVPLDVASSTRHGGGSSRTGGQSAPPALEAASSPSPSFTKSPPHRLEQLRMSQQPLMRRPTPTGSTNSLSSFRESSERGSEPRHPPVREAALSDMAHRITSLSRPRTELETEEEGGSLSPRGRSTRQTPGRYTDNPEDASGFWERGAPTTQPVFPADHELMTAGPTERAACGEEEESEDEEDVDADSYKGCGQTKEEPMAESRSPSRSPGRSQPHEASGTGGDITSQVDAVGLNGGDSADMESMHATPAGRTERENDPSYTLTSHEESPWRAARDAHRHSDTRARPPQNAATPTNGIPNDGGDVSLSPPSPCERAGIHTRFSGDGPSASTDHGRDASVPTEVSSRIPPRDRSESHKKDTHSYGRHRPHTMGDTSSNGSSDSDEKILPEADTYTPRRRRVLQPTPTDEASEWASEEWVGENEEAPLDDEEEGHMYAIDDAPSAREESADPYTVTPSTSPEQERDAVHNEADEEDGSGDGVTECVPNHAPLHQTNPTRSAERVEPHGYANDVDDDETLPLQPPPSSHGRNRQPLYSPDSAEEGTNGRPAEPTASQRTPPSPPPHTVPTEASCADTNQTPGDDFLHVPVDERWASFHPSSPSTSSSDSTSHRPREDGGEAAASHPSRGPVSLLHSNTPFLAKVARPGNVSSGSMMRRVPLSSTPSALPTPPPRAGDENSARSEEDLRVHANAGPLAPTRDGLSDAKRMRSSAALPTATMNDGDEDDSQLTVEEQPVLRSQLRMAQPPPVVSPRPLSSASSTPGQPPLSPPSDTHDGAPRWPPPKEVPLRTDDVAAADTFADGMGVDEGSRHTAREEGQWEEGQPHDEEGSTLMEDAEDVGEEREDDGVHADSKEWDEMDSAGRGADIPSPNPAASRVGQHHSQRTYLACSVSPTSDGLGSGDGATEHDTVDAVAFTDDNDNSGSGDASVVSSPSHRGSSADAHGMHEHARTYPVDPASDGSDDEVYDIEVHSGGTQAAPLPPPAYCHCGHRLDGPGRCFFCRGRIAYTGDIPAEMLVTPKDSNGTNTGSSNNGAEYGPAAGEDPEDFLCTCGADHSAGAAREAPTNTEASHQSTAELPPLPSPAILRTRGRPPTSSATAREPHGDPETPESAKKHLAYIYAPDASHVQANVCGSSEVNKAPPFLVAVGENEEEEEDSGYYGGNYLDEEVY